MRINSLGKGLVGHWTLAQDSLQSSVLLKDNTPYENVGTKYGSVLKFEESANNYVNCGNNASLSFGTSNFTLSAWVKVVDTGTAVTILDKRSATTGWGLYIKRDTSYIEFLANDGAAKIHYFAGGYTEINDGNWHLVTFVEYYNSRAILYIDGIAFLTDWTAIGNVDSAVDLYLGQARGSSTENYDGSMDDTRIYSRALSAAEVLTMYQGGTVSSTGLVAHYKMKDKSGTVLTDETAINNGTLTNFADTTAGYGNTHTSGWTTNNTPIVYAIDRKGNDNGVSFDGASDYVDMGSDSSLDITGAITISAWTKPVTSAAAHKVVVSHEQDDPANGRFSIRQYLSRWYLYVHYGGSLVDIDTGVSVTTDWQLVSATFDGDKIRFYKNSVLGFTSSSLTSVLLGDRFNIGTYDQLTNDFYNFNGQIDDVRIYNRALSADEITLLYDSYKNKVQL